MLKFNKITIDDKIIFDKYVCKEDALNSINDFSFFFLWNTKENITMSIFENLIILKWVFKNQTYYYSPSLKCVDDFNKCLNIIMQEDNTNDFYFAGIPEFIYNEIKNLPQNCAIEFDRNASDYIYATADLCDLKGKKLHAKRNFVNFFKKNYTYDFKQYDDSYFDAVLQIFDEWEQNSEHKTDAQEKTAIERALKNYKNLGLMIGLLFVNNKIQAFSISSKSQFNIGQVFFEKANTEYKGCYAMINYLTANTFLNNTQFINREEDMGIENLRKAKLSYYPTTIYNKYILSCKNK